MGYVDGFVAPVPVANRAAYEAEVKALGRLFVECGALEVVDTWGEDVPEGVVTSFPRAVDRREGETVCFGWVFWASRAARDAGWEKAMADPAFAGMTPTLYDGKRMIFGGFEVIGRTRKEG